jgi:hypothetical protein
MFELGAVRHLGGHADAGLHMMEEAIRLKRETEPTSELAHGLLYLGLATLESDLAASASSFAEALALATTLRIDRVTLAAMSGLAGVALGIGDVPAAAHLLGAVDGMLMTGSSGVSLASSVTAIRQQVVDCLRIEEFESYRIAGMRLTFAQATLLAHQIADQAISSPPRHV